MGSLCNSAFVQGASLFVEKSAKTKGNCNETERLEVLFPDLQASPLDLPHL